MEREIVPVELSREGLAIHNRNNKKLFDTAANLSRQTSALKTSVDNLASAGVGGGSSVGVIKESQSSSGNLYKRFRTAMSGLVISNDSSSSLTISLSGNNIIVRAGEVFSGYFDKFSAVDIKASGSYRVYGLELKNAGGGSISPPVGPGDPPPVGPGDPPPDPLYAVNVPFLKAMDTYEAKNTTGSNVSTFTAKTNIIIYEAHFFGPVETAQVWSLNTNLSLNKILFEGAVTGGEDVNGMSKIELSTPIKVKAGQSIGLNGYYGAQNFPIDLTTKESTFNTSSDLIKINLGVTFTAQKLTAENINRATDQYAWAFRFGIKAVKDVT